MNLLPHVRHTVSCRLGPCVTRITPSIATRVPDGSQPLRLFPRWRERLWTRRRRSAMNPQANRRPPRRPSPLTGEKSTPGAVRLWPLEAGTTGNPGPSVARSATPDGGSTSTTTSPRAAMCEFGIGSPCPPFCCRAACGTLHRQRHRAVGFEQRRGGRSGIPGGRWQRQSAAAPGPGPDHSFGGIPGPRPEAHSLLLRGHARSAAATDESWQPCSASRRSCGEVPSCDICHGLGEACGMHLSVDSYQRRKCVQGQTAGAARGAPR